MRGALLGQGTFGQVWMGTDNNIPNAPPVALKKGKREHKHATTQPPTPTTRHPSHLPPPPPPPPLSPSPHFCSSVA